MRPPRRKIKYIDISSYKAVLTHIWGIQTPFEGHHTVLRNPLDGRAEVILYADGYLEILPGFHHDWASGPTWDDRTNRAAALAHDALFRLLRWGAKHYTWKQADRFMYDVMVSLGCPKWRARLWLWGRAIPFVARGKQAKPNRNEPAYKILEA